MPGYTSIPIYHTVASNPEFDFYEAKARNVLKVDEERF
jgi:hypothetical protein